LYDFRKPDRYENIFVILAEEHIFPETFARNLVKMVGFRNILVHEYMTIRLDIVYKAIQENLSDPSASLRTCPEQFEEYILEFLEAGPAAKRTAEIRSAQRRL